MNIKKSSSVKFVANVSDKWGLYDTQKSFSFSIRDSNVIGSSDAEMYHNFLKAFEHGRLVGVTIAGEGVLDIPKAVEIVKNEVEKWKNVRYFKSYRVAHHEIFVGDEWVRKHWHEEYSDIVQESSIDVLVASASYALACDCNYHMNWNYVPYLGCYFICERDMETGKFSRMNDEVQEQFRKEITEFFKQKEVEAL